MARLIVISNRLPITIDRASDGFVYKHSSGGLVAALSGLKKKLDFLWVGWPGLTVTEEEKSEVVGSLRQQFNCEPIFISEELFDGYYNGFANGVLWPLFHYIPQNIVFNEAYWDAYVEVNRIFAASLVKIVHEEDQIWIHDYHLLLLPKFLRDYGVAKASIGFFLHIPFPSSEVFRILPYRDEILAHMLHCDLIGFHTYDYVRHFIHSCANILDLQTSPNSVCYKSRSISVSSFPIGIEPESLRQACLSENSMEIYMKNEQLYEDRRIILGIDRLDYIKGVPHKIISFAHFLDTHPDYIGKVVLIQVAIPTRSNVQKYQELKSYVDELVGRINGKYASPTYLPIVLMHHSISFDELAALYRRADVCLVTSTRDGMNLVSLEYVAVRSAYAPGKLILSEFAGAANSMRSCIVVNPWNFEETADAILKALESDGQDPDASMLQSRTYVERYTASFWADSFLSELAIASLKDVAI